MVAAGAVAETVLHLARVITEVVQQVEAVVARRAIALLSSRRNNIFL
jgi:hypothetical protein